MNCLRRRLIVGLSTDRFVHAIKGPNLPVIGERNRARVLAALASVDALVLFGEETPRDLIRHLHSDVLAKDADYHEQQVVGSTDVRGWGGQVVLIPLVDNQSSSRIIEGLKRPDGDAPRD